MISNAMLYLYYRLWDMHSRGEDSITGAVLAVMTNGLLYWLNIFEFVGFLRKIDLIPKFPSKTQWIGFLIFLGILLYILFVFNRKYEKIIEKFKDESKIERRKRGLIVLAYILFSIIVFICVVEYRPGYL